MADVSTFALNMAVKKEAGGIAQMHAVALAVAPEFAIGTCACLHPATVAIFFKAVLPHIPEIIFVDVALPEVGAYAWTSANPSVEQH